MEQISQGSTAYEFESDFCFLFCGIPVEMLFNSISTMLTVAGVFGEVQVNEAQPRARVADLDDDPHSGACSTKGFAQLANHEQ